MRARRFGDSSEANTFRVDRPHKAPVRDDYKFQANENDVHACVMTSDTKRYEAAI